MTKNSTRRVLFELVEGSNQLCDFDGDSFNTESVRAYLGGFRSNHNDPSSSLESYEDEADVQTMFTTSNRSNEPNDESSSDLDF